jgi:hypothetical protein
MMMPCCGQLDGTRFMPCLREALGLPPGGTMWDQNVHAALYARLSTDAAVQANRKQTAAQIAATAWGSEPETTGGYVMAFAPTFLAANNNFWSCLGLSLDDAKAQLGAESGDYYDTSLEAGSAASVAEGGPELGGLPTWAWALIIAGGLGAVATVLYLIFRK